MKLQNKVLVDLNNDPIKAGEETLTVATVLMNAAISAPGEKGEPRTKEEIAKREELARYLREVGTTESFELPLDMAVKLLDDVARVWVVLIAGQVINLVNGKTVN